MTTMSSAEPTRRDFLYIATASVAAFGAAATLVPLTMNGDPVAMRLAGSSSTLTEQPAGARASTNAADKRFILDTGESPYGDNGVPS